MHTYYRWVVLLVATLSQTAATFVTYGMGPVASFYQMEWHLTSFQTGLIVSAVNIGPIFSMLLFGYLMDKKGEKQIIGWGSILLGLSALLLIPVNHYTTLLLVLIVVGIWYGSAQTGGSTAIVKWFPNKHRGLAIGIRQTGIPIGGALASTLLTYLYQHHHLSSVHLAQGLMAVGGGLLFLLLYKEPKQHDTATAPLIPFKEKMRAIRHNRALYPLFFVGMVMMSLQMIIIAHFMSYLHHEGGYTLTEAGRYLSLILLGGMLGRIVLAWMSDQYFAQKREPLLVLVMVATFLMVGCLPFVIHSKGLMIIFCSVFGFLALGWYSIYITCVTEQSDSQAVGLTVSAALTINQFFIVLAPTVYGLLVAVFSSYQLALDVIAVMVILGAFHLYRTSQSSITTESSVK
ncbi:MFS transporter [Lysinibacillus sp. HST-98]|uniref:MFS transporter n=1 Tax=Lysinibacillus TaxID=400634 RepID=UPI0001DA56E8|nr:MULTISPECIES: MFS transporter [Lysinibacillus]EFI68577.1 major facilitator (MFS) superfamily protein [Lysinibacillus fusiformis ZC1]EKU43621.1 major facilitator (MFS) superfamily protein [Lysinibacillus fusiformis ZB2]MBL3730086.1 MFS transporter [Lysinibacillus sp. HST-98]MED4698311.1 MFS transporter [Lysinibacillus capsici]